ncbi:MAG: RNA polymerase sigma-70 factor [Candidatus Cyclobacteriaceae bacterium M3_2C_046]
MSLDKKHITIHLRKGNLEALKKIHDFYYDKFLYISIGFIKSRPDAEELVQDVFLKLWRNRRNLDVQLTYEGYLYTSLKRGIYNKLRDIAKINRYQVDLQDIYNATNKTDDDLIYQELWALYQKALTELPPQRQKVFKLRKIDGLSNKQVAEKLGISVKMVEKQMTQTLRFLKQKLILHKEILIILLTSASF